MGQRVRFYTDEGISNAIINGLRQRGIDVLTAPQAGLLEASDEDHLARALAEGRVVFTRDDDYLKLHARGIRHAGIAYARQGIPIRDVIRGLLLIHQILELEDMANHVEFL